MSKINFASEKDMQDVFVEWIKKTQGNDTQIEQYLKIGDYGIADVLVLHVDAPFYEGWNIDLYELKNRFFELKDLIQITRYAKGLEHIFGIDQEKIRLNIVCTGIDLSSDFIYLPDIFIEKLQLLISEISIDGINFESISGYGLKDQKKILDPEFIIKIKNEARKQADLYNSNPKKELV